MSKSQRQSSAFRKLSRRSFLRDAAGVAAGTALGAKASWGQGKAIAAPADVGAPAGRSGTSPLYDANHSCRCASGIPSRLTVSPSKSTLWVSR